MRCPKCGLMQSSEPQCKRCGAALALGSRLPARSASAAVRPPAAPDSKSANPYAPPAAESHGTPYAANGNLFRDGKLLVARDGAPFPDRCVRCNGPAEGYRLKKTFYWHPPGWYVLIFASVLIYAVVAMIIRKKATFELSLCRRHRRRRVFLIGVGLGIPVLVLIGWIATGSDVMGPMLLIAVLVGSVAAVVGAQTMTPKKIADGYAHLKGAHPEFLSRLPAVG